MSASDSPITVYHEEEAPSGSSESHGSSQYSNWVNSGVPRSHSIHCPDGPCSLRHTSRLSSSFEEVSTSGVSQEQLNRSNVASGPPEPVARIISRQAPSCEAGENIDTLKPESIGPSMIASDGSSLGYGGDLTLDDNTGQDHLHTPSPKRFATGSEIRGRLENAQNGDGSCFYEHPTTSCAEKLTSRVLFDHSWVKEHQRRSEDLPLPASPTLKSEDSKQIHDRVLERDVKSSWKNIAAVENDKNEVRRAESPCSSLLDLYLGVSRQPSINSVSRSTIRNVSWFPAILSDETKSQKHDNDINLVSQSRKLKSWVFKKISRLPGEDKRPNPLDFSYHELSQQRFSVASPRQSSCIASADGYTSPAPDDPDPKKQGQKHRPLVVSPEAVIYERERYAPETLGAAHASTSTPERAALSEGQELRQFVPNHGPPPEIYEPSESCHQSIRNTNSSQASLAPVMIREPEGMTRTSIDAASAGEPTSSSNFLWDHPRTLTWFSDRNMPPSKPSTRVISSDTNSSWVVEKQYGARKQQIPACCYQGDGSVTHGAASHRADCVTVSEHHGRATDNLVGDRDTESVKHDSKMPGSYPTADHVNQLRTDIPPASATLVASGQTQSRRRPVSMPSAGKVSKQVSIAQHKPAHERERYPEPYFIPLSASETRDSKLEAPIRPEENLDHPDQDVQKRMRDSVRNNVHPEIQPRLSSSMFRPQSLSVTHRHSHQTASTQAKSEGSWEVENGAYIVEFPSDHNAAIRLHSLDGETSALTDYEDYERISTNVPWVTAANVAEQTGSLSREGTLVKSARQDSAFRSDAEEKLELREFQRGHRRHHSFRGRIQASLHRANRKGVLARDWSHSRKRFTAIAACISTALIGLIVGIYAGQVPAIQYAIVDEQTHYAVLGNVFFYLGLAITTILAWPLPLLYGRKRFTLAGMAVVLALQFPQALVCSQQRDPTTSVYRVGLLLPRFISGIFIGLANMNFWPILLDVYGSSLQSQNPHQEAVNQNDPRRHGGGMGIWLGIWTWCHIGSIGVGFIIGAAIIGYVNVAWGFWIVIFATLAAMLLNVITPETRDPAFRKSMAEVRQGADVSRRVGRGEIMMHLYSTGPLHWWEEVKAGFVLNFRMLKQSGFCIMALYQGWIYGQVVMIMILLGALASRYYRLRPPYVGLCVAAFPLGALLAVPFQKASILSRSRHRAQRTDSMTFEKRVTWSSHLVRRTIFMAALPLAATAYTLTSTGPPLTIALPVLFAGFVGFLTNLALSECYGLIMETFDTSDLQPGMTGRLRKELSEDVMRQRTNFSCYPRVTAGFSIVQTVSFVIAAVATAVGGNVERARGVQTATGFVAAVLVGLTLLLIGALTRLRTVQVVPTNRVGTVELSGPGDDLPVIIGSPSGTTRRISLLELGNMTRWTEIRRRNKLLGSGRHGKYP